jgi:ferredoxin
MRIVIDKDKCIGCGTCVVIAPKAFDLDAEGKSILLPTAAEEKDDTLLKAAQACAVSAITLFDDNGKQIFPSN